MHYQGTNGPFGMVVVAHAADSGSSGHTFAKVDFDNSRVARTSSENRSVNTSYHPRLHA